MNKILKLASVLLVLGFSETNASNKHMITFTVDLPHHVLSYAIPKQYLSGDHTSQVYKRYDLMDVEYADTDLKTIGEEYFEFNGPFWVGRYGSMYFDCRVRKRSSEYIGDISTVDGLQLYLQWWGNNIGKEDYNGYVYNKTNLGGIPVASRGVVDYAHFKNSGVASLIVYAFPMNNDMYLEALFRINDFEEPQAGKSKKWRSKAEELREVIKASIKFTTKPLNEPSSQP